MNIMFGSLMDWFTPTKKVITVTQNREVVKFVEDAQAEFRAKKAFEAAEDAARREAYAKQVQAASDAGRANYSYQQWRTAEDEAAPASKSNSVLPLVALAAAGLYFWKG